ncbi:MAG: DUF4328 domain-containing protein [Fluviicola sp.]|nr:DUF4328 domain-containing protein [Fluviicola sp.]
MDRLNDNTKLSIWNERLLWGMFIVSSFIALELCILFVLNLFDRIELWMRFFDLVKPLRLYVNGCYFVLYISWNCIFFSWLYRSYSNVHLLKKEGLHAKSSIVWAWFIPIVNLYLPFRILKSLYSSELELTGESNALELKKMNRTINDMKVLWIFSWIFSVIIFVISFSRYLDQLIEIVGVTSLVVQISSVIYILCKIRFVRQIRALENKLKRQVVSDFDFHKPNDLIDSI